MTIGEGWACSRRAVLRVGALSVLAFGGPAPAGAQPKIDPKLVQYQPKPKADQQCDRCLHFIAPDGCKVVAGKISPKGWCARFAPKPK